MLEQNKILFFILVLIVLVLMFFMRSGDKSDTGGNPGRKAVSIEASQPLSAQP